MSQLRKDSLDYQKNADKIIHVLKKINNNKSKQLKELDITEGHNGDNDDDEKQREKLTTNLDNLNLSDADIFNFQKGLIVYLNSLSANDSSLKYSKYFLVGQWLKELNSNMMSANNNNQDHDMERITKHGAIEENRKQLYALIEKDPNANDLKSSELTTLLDMNEAFILSKYLCSLKKTLDKRHICFLMILSTLYSVKYFFSL